LILLIDPGQEGLLLIVEDATTFWPVTLHTSGNQVLVAGDEQEMVVHKLLSNSFSHAHERVVVTGQFSLEFSESRLHQLLNAKTLFLGDSG